MPTDKVLTANTSAIYISRSNGYENLNEPWLDNQAFIFDFVHHFNTTSLSKNVIMTKTKSILSLKTIILNTNSNNLIPFITALFLCFFSFTLTGQTEIKIGDEVTFKQDLDAKRFVVIGMEEGNLVCSILNKEGLLDTVSMKKTAVVSSYKNELNRKRMKVFTEGTKIKWRQKGKRVEGFVISYSPADPKLTAMVYLDSLAEERRIPVKYATPSFDASRVDTLRMLCKLWESDVQLFSYPGEEPEDLAIPIVGSLSFNETALEKPFQYMFENFRFAQLLRDDLQAGIVGSWKLVGNKVQINTKFAVVKDKETGKKKKIKCPQTYSYQFLIDNEQAKLKLIMPDWVAPPKEEAPEKEEELAEEATEKEESTEEEVVAEKEKTKEEKPSSTPSPSTNPNDASYKSELERVREELNAIKKEMREIKDVLKKDKTTKQVKEEN